MAARCSAVMPEVMNERIFPSRSITESAPAARTTVQSPLRWRADAAWKLDYDNLERLTPAEIAERRKEFDVVKAVARGKREGA